MFFNGDTSWNYKILILTLDIIQLVWILTVNPIKRWGKYSVRNSSMEQMGKKILPVTIIYLNGDSERNNLNEQAIK